MTQTANGRGAPSTRTVPRAGTSRTVPRGRATTREPRRPRPEPAERPWLGQWNSTVTSYYLLVGATALLAI
ncbi:MAG: hypothetical protein ACTMID_10075, partial [Cellulosimicrobium funkei]